MTPTPGRSATTFSSAVFRSTGSFVAAPGAAGSLFGGRTGEGASSAWMSTTISTPTERAPDPSSTYHSPSRASRTRVATTSSDTPSSECNVTHSPSALKPGTSHSVRRVAAGAPEPTAHRPVAEVRSPVPEGSRRLTSDPWRAFRPAQQLVLWAGAARAAPVLGGGCPQLRVVRSCVGGALSRRRDTNHGHGLALRSAGVPGRSDRVLRANRSVASLHGQLAAAAALQHPASSVDGGLRCRLTTPEW